MTLLSAAANRAARGPSTDLAWLECLTITHPDLGSPVLLINDQADFARPSYGGTFLAFPFQVEMLPRTPDRDGRARVVADGVDQRLIESLRALVGPPSISYEIVIPPDEAPVWGPVSLKVDSMDMQAQTVSLVCKSELDFLIDQFPAVRFAPWNASNS